MRYFIYIFLIISLLGCEIWEDYEHIKIEDNPIVCFYDSGEKCGGENFLIPYPSSYMSAVLPENLEVSIDPTTPFIVKFSDEIYLRSINSSNLIIIENDQVLDESYYNVDYYSDENGIEDKTILSISPMGDSWNPNSTYTIILLNSIKSNEKGLIFGKSKAWFLAISEFPLVDKDGNSEILSLDNKTAQSLQTLREQLTPQLTLLTDIMGISKFDITLLWSFRFKKSVVCFQEDVDGCKNDQIPIPSDYMSLGLPEGVDLNISKNDSFSLKFSDNLNINTIEDNIIILKKIDNVYSVLSNDKYYLSFDQVDQNGITDSSKIFIKPISGSWDSGVKYYIFIKKGVKNYFEEFFTTPKATFFGKLENSIFNDQNMENLKDEYLPVLGDDIETAKFLELLRLQYKDSIDQLQSLTSITRDEIIMFWSVTIDSEFIIPCFKSKDFPGCENSEDVPIPSDFLITVDQNGDKNINMPIDENGSELYNLIIQGINTLDGWSSSKGFYTIFSGDIDKTSLKTDITNLENNPPNIFVLKLSYNQEGDIDSFTPININVDFNNNWNRLVIEPKDGIWEESSTYLVVFTDGILGENGENLKKSLPFSLISEEDSLLDQNGESKYSAISNEDAQLLEYFRGKLDILYQFLSKSIEDGGLSLEREKIISLYTVTTQTVKTDMETIAGNFKNNSLIPKNLTIDRVIEGDQIELEYYNYLNRIWVDQFDFNFDNISHLALGTFKIPYLLGQDGVFDIDKLTGNLSESDFIDAPILIAFPKVDETVTEPISNNKVVIFQHGINNSKEQVLSVLNFLTGEGYIVISYDLIFHGERSIDITDSYDNDNPNRLVPDQIADKTGVGFLNLNLFATRDNIRQSVVEQIILVDTLKSVNFNNLNGNIMYGTIDQDEINYFGFSLGTVIGNIFISLEDDIKLAVLNAPGGVITDIFANTVESINGELISELSNMGIEKGSLQFENFLYLAQTILDPADPINYKKLGNKVMIQKSIDEKVIPNITTDKLGLVLGLIDPVTGEKSDYFKEYQMDDYDPYKQYWHSFTILPKSENISSTARDDIIQFFAQ